MTVNDLINGSLRLIGVLAEGENPTAQQQTDAFNALNDLIDSLSNESLMIWSKLAETFDLVAGQQTYQFGNSAPDWDSTTGRPVLIENALIIPPQTTPQPQLPMAILNKDEWAGIILKDIQSTIPLYLYNDDAYPYSNINLWPIPQCNTQIIVYSAKAIADFTGVTEDLSFPPGYDRMLRFNLAVELAPEYGKDPSQTVLGIAIQSKAYIKRQNIKPILSTMDPGLAGRKRVFNWLTGEAE